MDRVRPKPGSDDTATKRRTAVIVGIQLLIALAHVIGGRPFLRGSLLTHPVDRTSVHFLVRPESPG